MYEVLSGRLPIDGENSLEILHKQIIAVPLEFRELSPAIQLPKGLEAIIFKALDKDVDVRYQSMDELKNDLIQFKHNHHFVPQRSTKTGSSSQLKEGRAPLLATIALILLAVSIFAFAYPRTFVHASSTNGNPPATPTKSNASRPQAAPANKKKEACPTTAEEKALSKAVLSLTRLLERNGQGKQAQAELKELLNSEGQSLPANDPVLQDMRRIESSISSSTRKK